ncbi:MAG: VWA domain-containing protein [Epsilonproteobacteria bacterium]|nr:VWA domain-containing protein [Campylobacterota bacterium]
MLLHFAYAYTFAITIPVLFAAFLYHMKFYKAPVYQYPLADTIARAGYGQRTYRQKLLAATRFLLLLLLALLIARPQYVDQRSKINVEGISIALAIDISESMQVFDDLKDRRSRIEVAKKEAIRFIEKRDNDPIGIVIFGREALSRCPLTLDKSMLKELVGNIKIGMIESNGTWLGTGMATAINRLRNVKSKSKILILLTDGEPTPPEKIDPETATQLAQDLGIKIYTIGIGSEKGGYIYHPFGGVQPIQNSLNVPLLQDIAQKTGGQFFRARNPADMRAIYDKIDKLEKTEQETNVFSRYYEAFALFFWMLLCLLGVELFLRFFMWQGL